jgi:AbrB family looped-hinge helix DNA binding protein
MEREICDLFFGAATVGERGQVVIPAEARKHAGINPGDKVLVFMDPGTLSIVITRVDHVQALMAHLQKAIDETSTEGEE